VGNARWRSPGRGVQALVFARYGALHRRVKEDEEELLCGGIPIGEAGLGQVRKRGEQQAVPGKRQAAGWSAS
jgi:hypothetical protein